MLDNLKMLNALTGLMKNRDKLQTAGNRVREKMEATRCTGEAGGGAVRAVVTGSMKVISIELAPGLANGMAADDKTRALAGALIAEATNNAIAQAQEKMKEAIQAEAKSLGLDGIDLPGLQGMLGG